MNLSFLSYFDLIFYVILGFAILAGVVRGFKKSLFTFITMAIFYIVFFVTINPAVNLLWSINMPWLGGVLSNIDPSLSGFTSFQDSYNSILQVILGDNINLASVSGDLDAFATGLFQFVLKLVWTILYFTVILILYKIICLIIRVIFFKSREGENKNRLLGGVMGLANGLMGVFVFLVMLGGFMSVTESVVTLIEDTGQTPTTMALPERGTVYKAGYSLIPGPFLTDLDTPDLPVDDIQGMVDSYNNNILVKLADKITVKSVIDDTQDGLYQKPENR